MAWQIRGTAISSNEASNNQATGTIPAATQPGDYILQLVTVIANGASQTMPTGWTSLPTLTAGNTSSSLRGAFRTAQPGDAGTPVTFTLSGSTRWAMALIVIHEDAGGVPRVEQLTTSGFSSNTAAPTTPAITPANTDNLLISAFGGGVSVNGTQITLGAASGFTLLNQVNSTSPTLKNAALAVASRILPDGSPIPLATHSASANVAPVGASIMVSSHNTAPTANAGPDQTVDPGAIVMLNGSGSSDFDGSIASYDWQQLSGPPITLSDPTIAQPTFTAPSSVDSSVLEFGLIVTDNEGTMSAQDTVTITVGATSNHYVWDGTTMVKQPLRHWVGGQWLS